MDEYRKLRRELARVRAINGDEESAEEDEIMAQMDEVWWSLTDEQQVVLNNE